MMHVSSTESRDKNLPILVYSSFRTSTLKMIKYKYRLFSNILLYITSTFDMHLDTITKYEVHFRNYRYIINICTTK